MKNIKQKLLFSMLFLFGAGGGSVWATTATIDATITITPIATVSLSISPTTYAFGAFAVNSSTNSATGLVLSNNGQVDVSVTKQITNQSSPAGWTAGVAASSDTYVLYVASATTRPALGSYTIANHMFGGLNTVTSLLGLGGGSQNLNNPLGVTPSEALWFKLDLPTTVSSQTPREITVRFTGTAL